MIFSNKIPFCIAPNKQEMKYRILMFFLLRSPFFNILSILYPPHVFTQYIKEYSHRQFIVLLNQTVSNKFQYIFPIDIFVQALPKELEHLFQQTCISKYSLVQIANNDSVIHEDT